MMSETLEEIPIVYEADGKSQTIKSSTIPVEKVSEYGDEEHFIVTVDDDVLDNKFSDTEVEVSSLLASTLGRKERQGRISDMVRKQTPMARLT